ncbi:serine threonine kinase [Fusarium tjaetaba]|uniref:Serine threonine kinase n=1 Tax=Fusarium tjaetaba TaxID=1567544 RepID=A0A8H5W1X1_9HYPO|nr:serine threonine kinase [Fusarium tjaetaba]KAF5645962.1 serine threonine kinase [Fusarium tjaetaba]
MEKPRFVSSPTAAMETVDGPSAAFIYLKFKLRPKHDECRRVFEISWAPLEDIETVGSFEGQRISDTAVNEGAVKQAGDLREPRERHRFDMETVLSHGSTHGTLQTPPWALTGRDETSGRPCHTTSWMNDARDFVTLAGDLEAPMFYDFGSSSRSVFDEAVSIKCGGTSQVFRVQFHSGLVHEYAAEGKEEHAFALKKICNGTSQDYARERDAYRRLSLAQNPHPHIVPLLASYLMESKYHMVFPLADCDLAMYLRNQPKPSNDKRTLEWFGGQLRGLADALSTIHGQKGQAKTVYGVHGDIKPENILCFGSNDGDRPMRLALTDFGSSYFCTPGERDIPKGLKHTPAYRAPEIDFTTVGITQAYDVWSLGCVFAEVIAWFYEGRNGIAKLIDARLDEESNSPNRDAFFYVKYDFNNRGGLSAKLKPEIQRLMISLRMSSRSSLFMDDMLYIVLEGMLKINVSERMSAGEVLDALTQMCLKLENDPAYSESRLNSNVEMVHTQHARQRLDRTVDATHYTNVTTQSDTSAQISFKPRFACPYHKAGILVSVHHRACEGPGWIDVNKVKEHLFRCHLPKKYRGKHTCRRCDTSFETDELLLDHQHQETPCPKRKPEAIHGMLSREQAARLRSLKRKSSKESEEDRWFDIYRIAFPKFNRMMENISPYHESNTTSLSTINSTSSNGISQYKDYLLNLDAEEYATKLANMGIDVTLEAATKLLKLQVKDLESFDETMREPVRAYGFETDADHEKIGDSVPSGLNGSSDLLGQFLLLANVGMTGNSH